MSSRERRADVHAALLAAVAAGDAVALRAALAEGAHPGGSDHQGVPVLVLACRLGRLEVVEALLEAGAAWDDRHGGDSPPSPEAPPTPEPGAQALVGGLQQIVGALESFGGITSSGDFEDDFSSGTRERLDHDGENAFEAAIRRGHPAIVERLLQAGARVEVEPWAATPPLLLAARAGDPAVVRLLLAAGARADPASEETPLQAAAAEGHLGAVEALLEAGATPDLADDEGFTPLMIAASGGHLAVVQRLVAEGADVDHQAEGDCALACAVHGGHRHVQDFLSPLVSPALRDAVAEELSDQTELQRERGASMNTEDLIEAALAGELARVEAGLASGLDPNAIGSDGQTALHYAAFWGHLAVVDRLLTSGALVDVRSVDDGPANAAGTTALTLAAGSVFAQGRHRIVRRLIAAGADVDAQNEAGQTPLMNAIAEGGGFPKSVEALLEAGADPNLVDQHGDSALLLALGQGNQAIVDMLRAAGASEQGGPPTRLGPPE